MCQPELRFGTAGGARHKAVPREKQQGAKPLQMHEQWETRNMGWVSCCEPPGEHRADPQTSQGSPEHHLPGGGSALQAHPVLTQSNLRCGMLMCSQSPTTTKIAVAMFFLTHSSF